MTPGSIAKGDEILMRDKMSRTVNIRSWPPAQRNGFTSYFCCLICTLYACHKPKRVDTG